MIKCYMPLGDGFGIPWQALEALTRQTLKTLLVPCPTTPELNKFDSIVKSRNLIRKYAQHDEIFVMLDSDTIILDKNAFSEMLDFLRENPDHGAIALSRKPVIELEKDEFLLSCVMGRGRVLRDVEFRHDPGVCECVAFAEDCRDIGWKAQYFQHEKGIANV